MNSFKKKNKERIQEEIKELVYSESDDESNLTITSKK